MYAERGMNRRENDTPGVTKRFRRLLGGFGILSGLQAAGTVSQEIYDKNPITAQTALMSVFDGILVGTLWTAAKCEARGHWRMGSLIRSLSSGGHIMVAGYGCSEAVNRHDMEYDPRSFIMSSVLGATALGVAWYDRKKQAGISADSSNPNEVMAANLIYTKIGEGASVVSSTIAATASGDSRWLVAGAVLTTVSVAWPMLRQIVHEAEYCMQKRTNLEID